MPDLDPTMSPEMGHEQPEAGADHPTLELSPQDKEEQGKMAKADLYKLATYSHKLFKQLKDEDQLESWVQAKITKAADYMASVYHYLEYEMKFSEYGHHLDNSDTLSEGQKTELKNRLMEAKMKIAELKKSQAEKLNMMEGPLRGGEMECAECGGTGVVMHPGMEPSEKAKRLAAKHNTATRAHYAAMKRLQAEESAVDEEAENAFTSKGSGEMKVGDTKKTRTGELTKTSTGVKHKNTSYHDDGEAEEKSGKGVKSHAKAKDSATKKAERGNDIKLPKHSGNTWGMKNGEKFGKKMEEAKGKKPDFLDLDSDGDKKEPMKKAAADKKKMDEAKAKCCCEEKGKAKCPVHGKVEEAAKPSAGLSKEKKSATVKAAKKGEDIGKPGKGFKKVAAKAAKEYGSKEKGEKVAAAAMWKNIKETTAYMAEKAMVFENAYKNIGTTAFQNWLNDHGFHVPVTGIFDTATQAAERAAGEKARASSESEFQEFVDMLSVGTAYNVIPGQGVSLDKIGPILSKYGYDAKTGKKTGGGMMPSKESSEFTRMQEQLARLNRAEKPMVAESREVDQIRALTQKLLG
jgi:hypothetical protein